MPNFENGMFTYDDLVPPVVDPEQSIAEGVTVEGGDLSVDMQIEQQSMYNGLRESGVDIEPFEPFYADGTTPQLTAK